MPRLLSCLLLVAALPYGVSGQSFIKIKPREYQDLEIVIRFIGKSSGVSDFSSSSGLWSTEEQMRNPFEAASATLPFATNGGAESEYAVAGKNSPYILSGSGGANHQAKKKRPELTIAVTNQGQKRISAIRLEIVLNDKHCGARCVLQSLRVNKKVAPGKNMLVAKWKDSKSTPFEIQEAMRFGRFLWHVEIKEVEYDL
jgi:hypothetical protein